MAEVTTYNLAQFVYQDEEILVDKFKVTLKQDTETRTSTNSHEPYEVNFTGISYEWELTDVAPRHRKFFKNILKSQQENPGELPMASTYDYNEITGDLMEDDVFYDCFVKEISKENANQPFSVKGEALRMKR